MSGGVDALLRDACRRYIVAAERVSVDQGGEQGNAWAFVARWRIGEYTRAEEIFEALERVTLTKGRYRVTFHLRKTGQQTIMFTRRGR